MNYLFDEIANSHPTLRAGRVYCHQCGLTLVVNSAEALKIGWPKCCGFTMSLDSPEDRKAYRALAEKSSLLSKEAPNDR